MNKKQLFKELKTQFDITKTKQKDYDFDLQIDDTLYKILVLKSSSNTQITINSVKIWEIARGTKNGIRFKKSVSNLYDITSFSQYENKIVFLTNPPYRVLRYLNESDIVIVQPNELVNGIRIINSINEFNDLK